MALSINSITYSLTQVDSADTATGWSVVKLEGSGGAPSLLGSVGTIDLVAEGSDARATRTNKQRVQILYTASGGTYDFTANSSGLGINKVPDGIVYIWSAFLAAGSTLTKAQGGLQISLGDGTNTSYWNVGGSDTYTGGFKKWAAYTGIAPSETSGSPANLGNISQIGFVTDVGLNTTRFDNFVVDSIDIGSGLSFAGTTTADDLFTSAYTTQNTTRKGVLEISNGIIFAQSNLRFAGSAITSSAETMVFTDTLGGTYTYTLLFVGTGNINLNNSTIASSGAVNFDFDASGCSNFSMNGGSLNGFATFVATSGQTYDGVVFQAGGTSTISTTLLNSSFNNCDIITLSGSGTLSGCNINNHAATGVVTSSLTNIVNCSFTSPFSPEYGIEITTPGTYTLEGTSFTGYAASGVGTAIYNNSGGLVTINLVGSDTPTVNNGTGASTVIQVAATLTINNLVANTEVRVFRTSDGTALGGVEDATVADPDNPGRFKYDFAYTVAEAIYIQVINLQYEILKVNFTLDGSNAKLPISQKFDRNYSNPA